MERCSRIALFFKKGRPTRVKRRTTQHEQSVDVPSTKLSTVSYRFCPVVGMPFGRRNPQLQRSWVFIYAVGRQKKIWGLEEFTPFIGIFEFIRGKNGNFLVRPRGREGEARNAKMKKNLQPILSINDHNMILMIPCCILYHSLSTKEWRLTLYVVLILYPSFEQHYFRDFPLPC
jgi:hypothetical protein